jgi:hypothetical protein
VRGDNREVGPSAYPAGGSILSVALAPLTNTSPILADDGKQPAQGWTTRAHDAPQTGVSSVKAQSMRKIHWQTPVDLQPVQSFGELLNHYGSPLITAQADRKFKPRVRTQPAHDRCA